MMQMIQRSMRKGLIKQLFSTQKIQGLKKYSQKFSVARPLMSLYSLDPMLMGQIFIAPNATIIGEVFLGNQVAIWHGTVIRGDINSVLIHRNVSIGNNCVLHTAASTSTGLTAAIQIEGDTVIQSGCTLYSCTIHSKAFIGHNSVILEGAIIEQGAIIAPNSVVPPGRLVKAHQVWGGNPIKYIRKAHDKEAFVTLDYATILNETTKGYKHAFLPYRNAYLYKHSSPEDIIKQEHVPQKILQDQYDQYDPSSSIYK